MRNSRTGVPSVAGARGAAGHGVDLAHIGAWARSRRGRSPARGQRPLGPHRRCRPAIPIIALTGPMPIPIPIAGRGGPSGTRSVSRNSHGDVAGRA